MIPMIQDVFGQILKGGERLPPTLINDLDVIVLLDENRTAFRKAQNLEKGKTGLIDIT
jgi:hypothetical protein